MRWRRTTGAVAATLLLVLAASRATAATGVDHTFAGGALVLDLDAGDDVGLAIGLAGDGGVHVAGRVRGGAGDDLLVARFAHDGARDATFGRDGVAVLDLGGGEEAQAIVSRADGSVLVAGRVTRASSDVLLARLAADGSADAGFGTHGSVVTDLGGDDRAHTVVEDHAGRVLVAATSRTPGATALVLLRHLASGRLDPGFGSGGKVVLPLGRSMPSAIALAVVPDGSIVAVAAGFDGVLIVRRDASGAPSASFGLDATRARPLEPPFDAGAALVQSDGRIVLAGLERPDGGIVVARLASDGTPDPTFGTGGRVDLPSPAGDVRVHGLAMDPRGALVLAGSVRTARGDDVLLARLGPAGAVDTSFGRDGVLVVDAGGADDEGLAAAVQPDGRIVVTGATGGRASRDVVLARIADDVASCGDGVVDAGEACDAGARNGAPDGCCDTTCAPRVAGAICRAPRGACDVAEACDGTSAWCPDDAWQRAGAPCRQAAGACDVAETCSGTGPECPRDAVRGAGAVCRVASGACDVDEKCDGEARQCPDDRKSTGVCRSPRGSCDGEEWCDGASNDCPADDVLPDGSACEDGSRCTVDDACLGGICLPGLTDPDACSGYLCSTVKRVETLVGRPPSPGDLGDTSGELQLGAAHSVCEPVVTGWPESGVEDESEAVALMATRPSYAAYDASRPGGGKAAKRRIAAAGGRAPSGTLSGQFGALEVDLQRLRLVSLPAAVGGTIATADPPGGVRYECHGIDARAVGEGGTPDAVSVRTAHDEVARHFTLQSARQVCRAVDGASGAAASDGLLVCYGVKPPRGERRAKASSLVVQNSYETWLVQRIGQQQLCVPAVETSGHDLAAGWQVPEPRERQIERKRPRPAKERKPARKSPPKAPKAPGAG